jgi:hypothetical protein
MGMFFILVQHMAQLCLQWQVAQLFQVAWAGSVGQCSVYLSLISIHLIHSPQNLSLKGITASIIYNHNVQFTIIMTVASAIKVQLRS